MYFTEPSLYGVTLPHERIQNPLAQWQSWQNFSKFAPQSFLPQSFGYGNPYFQSAPTWPATIPFSMFPQTGLNLSMVPGFPFGGFPYQGVPYQGIPFYGTFPAQNPYYGVFPNIPFQGTQTQYPWFRPFVG